MATAPTGFAPMCKITAPKQYFLYPDWFGQQSVSTYTATQPPPSASVSAALDGKQPAPSPRSGSMARRRAPPEARARPAILRTPDLSGLIDTMHCHTDRSSTHRASGSMRPALPRQRARGRLERRRRRYGLRVRDRQHRGQSRWRVRLLRTWGPLGVLASSRIRGSGDSLHPGREPAAEHRPRPSGPTFGPALTSHHSLLDETTVDLKGEVCKRSIGYKWVYTREVILRTWVRGMPSHGWSVAAGALSQARFFSGGSVVVEGHRAVCLRGRPTDPNSIGIDCSAFPNGVTLDPQSPW